MMKKNQIDSLSESLIRKYSTNDPFELAECLNVLVVFDDIRNLKGYYANINRSRLMVINSKLDEPLRKLVCAHELGHDRLHSALATISPLRDEGIYSPNRTEIEANRFAAGLLVPTETFVELVSDGYTIDQIASSLNTFPEIISIKMNALAHEGIQLRLPDLPFGNFIKDL